MTFFRLRFIRTPSKLPISSLILHVWYQDFNSVHQHNRSALCDVRRPVSIEYSPHQTCPKICKGYSSAKINKSDHTSMSSYLVQNPTFEILVFYFCRAALRTEVQAILKNLSADKLSILIELQCCWRWTYRQDEVELKRKRVRRGGRGLEPGWGSTEENPGRRAELHLLWICLQWGTGGWRGGSTRQGRCRRNSELSLNWPRWEVWKRGIKVSWTTSQSVYLNNKTFTNAIMLSDNKPLGISKLSPVSFAKGLNIMFHPGQSHQIIHRFEGRFDGLISWCFYNQFYLSCQHAAK